jgi:hypothetical protein
LRHVFSTTRPPSRPTTATFWNQGTPQTTSRQLRPHDNADDTSAPAGHLIESKVRVQGKLHLNYSRGAQQEWELDIPGNVRNGDADWPAISQKRGLVGGTQLVRE